MTTPHSTLLLLLLSTLTSAGCAGAPDETQPAGLRPIVAPVPPVAGRMVVIVKSKAPWYAFDFILPGQFKKALPTYQQLDGLRFKAFSIYTTDAQKSFGGIYLWDSEAQARAWFTPAWTAEVERKRGQKPVVDYYVVLQDVAFVGPSFDYRQRESDCVTVFVHALSPALRQACLAHEPGLLRTYVVQEHGQREGALLLFATAENATAFLKRQQVTGSDWFRTPVLLNNARQ